jgi:hypothetical protein
MAELMQNQFGLKPKMQGPAYKPSFPEWYYNVLLPPRVKPPTEFTKFSNLNPHELNPNKDQIKSNFSH